MCANGACPECKTGTRRTHEPASPDADVRYRAVVAVRVADAGRARAAAGFEAFCAERDAAALDALELLAGLPTFDPEA
jgi:hypothetical protein